MAPLKERHDLIVMFVDSYDVLLAAGPEELLGHFGRGGARLLFSAEAFCWPQWGLAPAYPPAGNGKRYLNSGGFVGFAPTVWRLVQRWRYRDDDDDQLFYTRLYLDPALRAELGLALDHRSQIFQNLNGAIEEVKLHFEGGRPRVRNALYGTAPVVLHGNGPTKLQLNSLGNYVPNGWSPEGCGDCDRDVRPAWNGTVLLAVFVEQPTPFLDVFLRRLLRLEPPGGELRLFVHNREVHHEPHIAAVWPQLRRRFASVKLVGPEEAMGQGAARDMGMAQCRADAQCSQYISVDADAALTNSRTLRALLAQNRPVLAPLLSRPGKLWSNFWGAVGPDGFYARSEDYVDIVQGRRRGVWNVPYVSHVYAVGGAVLRGALGGHRLFSQEDTDPDMAWCRAAREGGTFLHVTNREHFGHLLSTAAYNTSRLHPDLWQFPDNPLDWEEKYVHENYSRIFEEGLYEEPCPDVYQFPLFSERFAADLRAEVQRYGGWNRQHHEVGAEAVPLSLLSLPHSFLGALRRFLGPPALHLFPGYRTQGRAVLSSVVRYRPLSDPPPPPGPEHGPPAATVTVSIGLGGDHQGGGWRFPRYDCSVAPPPPGWALLHPGRLTHRPQALPPLRGAHYVLLTLLDP